MIVPDTKDWTWVIARPCGECGFDGRTTDASATPDLVRRNVMVWRRLLDEGRIRAGRADEARWSSLEYACHVRDVFRRYDERFVLMLTEDDPLFPNWDQDATAVEDNYDGQDPVAVVAELAAAAERVAARLDQIGAEAWSRPGRRSDGASFTVSTMAVYMIHDPIHHVWDVAGATSVPV